MYQGDFEHDLAWELEEELASELELEWETDALSDFKGLREWEQTSACPKTARTTVSGFSRYANSVAALPQEEQAKVKAMAANIAANQRAGRLPLFRVQLTGHADRD